MLKKNIIALSVAAFLLGGCSVGVSSGQKTGTSAADGGFYRSATGDTWQQKTLIPTTTGKPKTFAGLNVLSMTMDPSDPKAIYVGTLDNGLYYTYDSGNEWRQASALGKITINSIAVDHNNKCIIYAATRNKVYKTTDCSRTWTPIFFENDIEEKVTYIAIDHYNSNVIYVGISHGVLVKSIDQGLSWKIINTFKNEILKILISPHDSRVIFVATKTKGIFRSSDGGDNWIDLSDNFKNIDSSPKIRDIAMTKAENGLLVMATNYGLLRSVNNGDDWTKIDLITPEKDAIINSLVVNEENAQRIYYVTNATFYRSLDGGNNWTTRKFTSKRAGWVLLNEPAEGGGLFLGVKEIKN